VKNELKLQKDVCQLIEAHDGFARKLSHRFVIGVADLLIKLPDHPAALLEVKRNRYPAKAKTIVLDVTKQQRRFLWSAHCAGMSAGVLSFLQQPKQTWVSIVSIPALPEDCEIHINHHPVEQLWGLLELFCSVQATVRRRLKRG
jgi:hypothetical protein